MLYVENDQNGSPNEIQSFTVQFISTHMFSRIIVSNQQYVYFIKINSISLFGVIIDKEFVQKQQTHNNIST